MIRDEILNNQALKSSALFFDEVYKTLVFDNDAQGRPMGYFCDVPEGVKVKTAGGTRPFPGLIPVFIITITTKRKI